MQNNKDIIQFHSELKQHCKEQKGGCEKCCMRLYCYTPFSEKTDYMVGEVIAYLDIEHNRMGDCNHSDRHTSDPRQMCPCNMDMSTALGYEHH